MDIRELCNVLMKDEMNSRRLPSNGVNSYFVPGVKAIANNAPEVVAAITATPFSPYVAIPLLLKIAKDFEGEITADKKLEKLIASPYKDGLEHLKIAGSARFDNTRRDELNIASRRFLTASTVDHPLIAAKAKFLAGVCYELLGEKNTALDKYREAYEEGQQEINERLSKLRKIKSAAFGTGVAASVYEVGTLSLIPVVGPLMLYGMWKKRAAFLGKVRGQTDKAIDALKAREIQEIDEFQESFLAPLSDVLSRREFPLIEKSGDYL